MHWSFNTVLNRIPVRQSDEHLLFRSSQRIPWTGLRQHRPQHYKIDSRALGRRHIEPWRSSVQCTESSQLQSSKRHFAYRIKLRYNLGDLQSNRYLQRCRRGRFAAHPAGQNETSLLGTTQRSIAIGGGGDLKSCIPSPQSRRHANPALARLSAYLYAPILGSTPSPNIPIDAGIPVQEVTHSLWLPSEKDAIGDRGNGVHLQIVTLPRAWPGSRSGSSSAGENDQRSPETWSPR